MTKRVASGIIRDTLTDSPEVGLRFPGRKVLTIAVLVAVLLGALAGAGRTLAEYRQALQSAGVPPTPPREVPNTDVNPYGANFFLAREVELWKREKTVQMAAAAGIRWAKQQFSWEEIEPRKGDFRIPTTGESSWGKYDQIVDLLRRYGMEVIARLDRPPDWTRRDNTLKERPPDNFADYGNFVYEFVRHFKGRVHYIQIWNEPNIYPEWGERPVDPAAYVELLKIAYLRAKEADPNIVVLSAPLAITLGEPHPEPGKWRSMSDLQFLEEMYKAGAKDYFDILSANAFGMSLPPEDPPDPNKLNFSRVVLLHQIMEKYGDNRKAVWFNEYGWNAAPESFPKGALIWGRVDEETQAQYTVRGIEVARQQWPWVGVFCIWYFRQVGQYPADEAAYYFRMVDPDFTPRRLYYAIKEAAAAMPPAGPGTHEETSPVVTHSNGWERILAPQVSGGGYLEASQAGESLTFAFSGHIVNLVVHKSPYAGRLLVNLDGRYVPGLPTDEQGRSYIDLYSNSDIWTEIPVIKSTGSAPHTLTLMVAEQVNPAAMGAKCGIDAFVVRAAPTPAFPYLPLGAFALVTALALAGLARAARRRR